MTIAQYICLGLFIEFVALCLVDIWLDLTGRQMITTAMQDFNSASGWLVCGAACVLLLHLFALPKLMLLWHWWMAR